MEKTRLLLVFTLFLLHALALKSQAFTDSNLPIVLIETPKDPFTGGGIEIPDENRIFSKCRIIQRPNHARNYLSDTLNNNYLNYNGLISIETRGSSSQLIPKFSYSFTTFLPDSIAKNNQSLLGMPAENDWVLNAMAYDTSFVRDYISYNLSRRIGQYAPQTAYCEVIINNEYRGLYLLTEKIKVDANRVNIVKMDNSDNNFPNITGGYITKADKTTGGDPVAWTMDSYTYPTDFVHDTPKPSLVTAQQDNYIHNVFNQIETTASMSNHSLINGYPSILDVPTFLDYMIINELASNVDVYRFSTYFHKDRQGKLRAGPVWDCNLTYGNDLFSWGYDRSHTNIWQFSNTDNTGPKFWKDLFNDSEFRCYFAKRWNTIIQPGQALNYNHIADFIDSTTIYIAEASLRDDQKWNPGNFINHTLIANKIKSWLNQRITWMTGNILSSTACFNVQTPPLVITKIHYNPTTSAAFPSSSSQEFIEIRNIGANTVNLSGIYFSALGMTYQFPYNSTIDGHKNLFLANDSLVFLARYGFPPFGEFHRNLSNSGQKLVLSDAFGNIIDYVAYSDSTPWPLAPDGNGLFLQLKDSSLDNSLASSWVEDYMTDLEATNENNPIVIYPNPVQDILYIHTNQSFEKIELFEINGNLRQTISSKINKIDVSAYSPGIYFIKIYNQQGTWLKKIIKL